MSYTDDLILNSIKKSREDNTGEPDSLMKAMNKAGLVQKEVQVQGKNGQVFTRKQWVKAGEEQSKPQKGVTQQPDKKSQNRVKESSSQFTGKNMNELCNNLKSAGYEMDSADKHSPQDSVTLYKDKQEYTATFNKYSDGGVEVINIKAVTPASDGSNKTGEDKTKGSSIDQKFWTEKPDNPKQALISLLQSGASRTDIMASAKENGISWKENDHEGINWMRCSMAIQKHFVNGETAESAKDEKISPKQIKKSTTKHFENGSIDKDGELVGLNGDKDYLGDLIEEITNEDMFDWRDRATEMLSEHMDGEVTIESLDIGSAKVDRENHTIDVLLSVEGYSHIQSDDGLGDDDYFEDKFVTIHIPYKGEV